MGGYVQGGGHSPLSSIYGIAADHVLGFEVVTPLGDFITVNSTSEPDLFWALKGGGGGTFGVVTSVTIKTYKDLPITTATWTLDSATIGKDKFWAGVKALIDRILDHVDAGTYSYYNILPSTGGNFVFNMAPFFAPNKTATQVNTLLGSYFSAMTALNIPFSPKITEYKSFYPAWQAAFPLERMGGVNSAPSSRLFPRSNFASETGRNITFNTLRQTIEAGLPLIAFHMAPKLMAGNAENAVNPAWRTAVMHAITRKDWPVPSSPSSILSIWKTFTSTTMQKWRDVAPGSGSYLNEADRLEPNWQQSFWGSNYARLAEIKKNWDRKDVFWAVNAVGSEGWTVESVDSLPNENGKLCKVATTSTAAAAQATALSAPVTPEWEGGR
jgi:FAD/FMN-containing dehydrogenase